MGFKDFCKSVKEEKVAPNKNGDKETKKVEELYDEYKDKSEDELMQELFKNVQKQKNEGSFNYDSLKTMIDKISPFLNVEQKLKIKDLLEKLK